MAISTIFASPVIRDKESANRLLDVLEETSKHPYVFSSHPKIVSEPEEVNALVRELKEKYGRNSKEI